MVGGGCEMKRKFYDVAQLILNLFLIVFGLYVAYQLILKLLGGSWMTENLIIAFLVMNIGLTLGNTFRLVKLSSDYGYLRGQFNSLVRDLRRRKII